MKDGTIFYIAPSQFSVVQTNLRAGTTGDTLNINPGQYSSSGSTPEIYVETREVQNVLAVPNDGDDRQEYEKYLRPTPMTQPL
jgi:hypothetical protein